MLSIGTVTAGNAAQRAYHERQLAQSRDDYYREAEGPAGTWVGSAAAAMGLEGEVTVEQFGRMLDGQHPDTGEALGGRMDRRKTLAFDLAFSAPKSVSLMRMAASPETAAAIDRAHGRAVESALRYIEAEGWKGRERRGGGERVTVDGSGVMGVLYRHETTRNADPQLHSHAVLANVVRGPDGRPMAINSPVLYQQAKTAGTVYQAVLRGELGRELGVEFDRPVNGLADIKGFDRELVDRFSTRRGEILEQLRSSGLSAGSKLAAERAALESRRAKDMDLDHAVWRVETRQVLEHAGFGREEAQAFVGSTRDRDRGVVSVADRLAGAPVDQLSAQRATEDARPVRQAAMSVAAGYTAEEVDQALERVFEDERLVQVHVGEKPRWTTTRHLELEQQLQADTLERVVETTGPRITKPGYRVPATTPDGDRLSAGQRAVLGELLGSGRGVEVVRARAGAGKTTIAGIVRREFEDREFTVVGVAPTLQALAELDDVGLKTRETLARTAMENGEFSQVMRTMDARTVVVVDEAGMAQTREIAPLLERARERGAKVIAIGDDVQLQAVGAGGWFRYLAEHQDVPVLELTEVHRQRDPVERDRLNQLHRGDVRGWIRWADGADRIAVESTVKDAYATAVGRYRGALAAVDGDVDRVVVMATQNVHRAALNERLRRVAVDAGMVDRSREVEIEGVLVAPGDRLVATATVRGQDGRTRVLENGERFVVREAFTGGVRCEAVAGRRRGQTVDLPAQAFAKDEKGRRPVEHGYARTVHKAQGMTVDRSILFAPDPGRLGQNLAYVGLSRTRERADLVTVAPGRQEGLDRLARGMGERRDHEAAVAYIDRDSLDPARLTRMGARELDEHRHALLVEAGETMVRLERLDRELQTVRGRLENHTTHDELLAERQGLVGQVNAHDRDAAKGRLFDPDRADIAQIQDRIAALDIRLSGREEGEPVEQLEQRRDELAERTHRDRTAIDGLLKDLDHTHHELAARAHPETDPATLPEAERPGVFAREARERQEAVRGMRTAAGEQLGAAHPTVARWLEHGPGRDQVERDRGPSPTPNRAPAGRPPAFTRAQREFEKAMAIWQRTEDDHARLGGHPALARLDRVLADATRTERAVEQAQKDFDEHTAGRRPSKLSRTRFQEWDQRRERYDGILRRARAEHREALDARNAVRAPDGTTAETQRDQLTAARHVAEKMKHQAGRVDGYLATAGPDALHPDRARQVLGDRDRITTDTDRRRFDALAGRQAIRDVVRHSPNIDRDLGRHWEAISHTARLGTLDRDVALWRRERSLDLSPTQNKLLVAHDREQQQRQDRSRGIDHGYDR